MNTAAAMKSVYDTAADDARADAIRYARMAESARQSGDMARAARFADKASAAAAKARKLQAKAAA